MKLRKEICLCLLGLTFMFPLAAETTLSELLTGYFQNNLSLQNLSAEVEQQMLSHESTKISQGLSFKISSGTIRFITGDSTTIKFSPSASFSIPQGNNLSFTLSSSFDSSAETKFTNTSLSLSADLFSGNREKREIALLKSQRTLLTAQRNLQNGFVTAEKEFYTYIKSLFQIAVSIIKAEKDLYDDEIKFEEVRAKGYSTGSSKYRSAQMQVLSDRRTVENNQHELEREMKIFYSRCGKEYDGSNAMDFLPDEIISVQTVDVHSFNKNDYTEIESALWTKHINDLTRQADKAFSLTASVGYTFGNKNAFNNSKVDSLDAGLGFALKNSALSVNTGLSLPMNTESLNPSYSLGFSLDPSAFFENSISEKKSRLDEEQEMISIRSAENKYETAVITQETSLEDILWSKKSNLEFFTLYSQLEADNKLYFDRGVITESEYRSSHVNKENYRIQCLINDIQLIIYNDETQLLFRRDGELLQEEKKETE